MTLSILTPTASLYYNAGTSAAVLPVTAFDCTYRLNAIPTAHVTVPGGYDLDQMLAGRAVLSPIHAGAPTADNMAFAQLTVGGYVVIRGYITGASETIEDGALAYSIGIAHWLTDLSLFTGANATLSPPNPMYLGGEAVEAGIEHPALTNVPIGPPSGDLWYSVVQPFLVAAATLSGAPQSVIQALQSIKSGVPLVLEPSIAEALGSARDLVCRLFQNVSASGRVSMSCLQQLLNIFCPLFGLDLAPAVLSSYLVPAVQVCPTPVIGYGANQCLALNTMTDFKPPVGSCVVYSKPRAVAFDNGAFFRLPVAGMASWRPVGTLLLREAPVLLDEVVDAAVRPVSTTVVNTFAKNETPRVQGVARSTINPAVYSIAARAELLEELYNGRSARVRLGPMHALNCAAPGSTVTVIPATLGGPTIYGRVEEVTIFGDSTQGDFHIEYVLTACRTLYENLVVTATGGVAHPYFGSVWSGGGLVS